MSFGNHTLKCLKFLHSPPLDSYNWQTYTPSIFFSLLIVENIILLLILVIKKIKLFSSYLGMEGQINFFLILSKNFQLIFSNNKLIADGSKVRKREFGG